LDYRELPSRSTTGRTRPRRLDRELGPSTGRASASRWLPTAPLHYPARVPVFSLQRSHLERQHSRAGPPRTPVRKGVLQQADVRRRAQPRTAAPSRSGAMGALARRRRHGPARGVGHRSRPRPRRPPRAVLEGERRVGGEGHSPRLRLVTRGAFEPDVRNVGQHELARPQLAREAPVPATQSTARSTGVSPRPPGEGASGGPGSSGASAHSSSL